MFALRTKLVSLAVTAATVWAVACTATRNSDGSLSIQFAPDMTITAWGLEDALEKLTDLLDRCITGNFERPCTRGEMAAINEAIDNVLESKERLLHPRLRESFPPKPL